VDVRHKPNHVKYLFLFYLFRFSFYIFIVLSFLSIVSALRTLSPMWVRLVKNFIVDFLFE